jgi:ribosomal protein S18 acetylase RimI-like enzyme
MGLSILPYSDPIHRSQVIALWESVFAYEAPHNRPSVAIDKKLAANDRLLFVAVAGNSVVGTIMAGYDGHRGWIYSVAVSPTHRHQGIGTRLMFAAEDALRALGCMKINLMILSGNAGVAAFYKALGYSIEERVQMGKIIPENVPKA